MDATATDLHFLELTELAARIEAREVSPVAVTRAQLCPSRFSWVILCQSTKRLKKTK